MLFVMISQLNNLPSGLLSAVCYVESNHVPTVVHHDDGIYNSVGICQIQFPTAYFLGFRGKESQLHDVELNIRLAAHYLEYELRRYHGDVRKAVSAYNMGTYRVNDQGEAVNKKYVDKVMKAWKEHR